jgi:hypothetical protein
MFAKKEDCPFLRFECFDHVNFAINEKYSKKIYFTCVLSNIQKTSFKECPFWFPLTMFKYPLIINTLLKLKALVT